MLLRQSTIKMFMECPLKYRFNVEENAPREQSSAMSFGTAIHEAVLVMEVAQSLQAGVEHFLAIWDNLGAHGLEYDYLLPRNSHDAYRSEGERILRDWWPIVQWEVDVILGREFQFTVPLKGFEFEHQLTGTIDKLALRELKGGETVLLVSDYKTGSKLPTRSYLRHDLQFTAYGYASTQLEFWQQLGMAERYYEFLDLRRVGEWVHLRGPQRVDAGERGPRDYNRLRYAADGIERTIAFGSYVPTISGTACEFCEFRRPCGMPEKDEE